MKEQIIKILESYIVDNIGETSPKIDVDAIPTIADEILALQLLQTGVSGSRRFNIDFCGNLLAGIEINNNIPFVFGAMNGYGNGINVNDISVTEIINDCH